MGILARLERWCVLLRSVSSQKSTGRCTRTAHDLLAAQLQHPRPRQRLPFSCACAIVCALQVRHARARSIKPNRTCRASLIFQRSMFSTLQAGRSSRPPLTGRLQTLRLLSPSK